MKTKTHNVWWGEKNLQLSLEDFQMHTEPKDSLKKVYQKFLNKNLLYTI